ncbi:methyltransferase domain-containing protein [Hydrogenophaga sp.]|uniref:class I SAM-dependent methyltransferase n=1 Tax=Hydrogenophaga sp. TaxID=1904254 RepID=UPI003D0C0B6C
MNATPDQTLLSRRFARDAGPAVRLGAVQHAIRTTVANKLSGDGYRMLSDSCACCGQSGTDVPVSSIDRYGLPLETVLCSRCGTLRANPYPDDDGLADFYTHHYQQMYARSDDRVAYFAKQRGYGQRVLEAVKGWLPEGAFVFEAGCGAGGALDVLREGGYQVSGCDYSQELVDHGRTQGLSLHWGPPLAALKSLPAPSLIYMHHVFEHVRDPLRQLEGLRDALAPGGKVLIIVPDVSRISEFPFPAGDLRLFLHIAHRFNFSLAGFRMLAARAGLEVESLEQRDANQSPEFWAVLTRRQGPESAPEDLNAGRAMLDYLRRTERRWRLHLTRGQLLVLRQRIRSKLKRILGRRDKPPVTTPTDAS